MPTSCFEIDDTPLVEAVFSFTAKSFPSEPDVGIFHRYWEIEGEVTGGKLGDMSLTRAQMIEAFGQDEIDRLEECECEAETERRNSGDFSNDDAYDAWAAE